MDKNKLAVSVYDKIAQIYTNRYFEDLIDASVVDRFLSLLPKGAKIMDIGCGSGNFTKYMLDHGYAAEGIDLSEEMIKIARQKVSGCDFKLMDMRNLKYLDHSFAGLLAAYSLIHIPSEEIVKTLKGFYRVLTSGGFMLVIAQAGEPDRIVDEPLREGEKIFINFFTRKRLSNFLTQAGFEVVFQKEKQVDDIESFSNRVIYTIARKV